MSAESFFRGNEVGAPRTSLKSFRRFRIILIVIFLVNLLVWLGSIWGAVSGAYLTNPSFLIAEIAIAVPINILAAILVWRDAKRRGRHALAWALVTYWGAVLAIPAYLGEIGEAILPPVQVQLSPSRPRNPDGLTCPYCQSQNLVVEKDRSALCLACKRGIHPTSFGQPAT